MSIIISKRSFNQAFNFSSEFMNSWCKFVKEYTPSNYRQIEMISLVALNAVLSYHGHYNLPLFVLDISESGTGKTKAKNFILSRIFKPIMEQTDNKISFHIANKISAERLYQIVCDNHKRLFVELSEIGNDLSSGDMRIKELLNLLTDKNNADNTLIRPEYKNTKDLPNQVTGVKFTLLADTNLQQLGSNDKIIKQHLGGLFNRFVFIYTQPIKNFNDAQFKLNKPNTEQETKMANLITKFHTFSQFHCNVEIDMSRLNNNPNYLKLNKKVHKEKLNKNNEYKELYNRAIQNVNAVIQMFHYLAEFERFNDLHDNTLQDFVFNPTPNNATINAAIDFIMPYLDLKPLIKAINEYKDTTHTKRLKALEYIKKHPKTTYRNILRNVYSLNNFTTNQLRQLLDDFVEKDEKGYLKCLK